MTLLNVCAVLADAAIDLERQSVPVYVRRALGV